MEREKVEGDSILMLRMWFWRTAGSWWGALRRSLKAMEALTEEEIFLQTKILVLEQVKTEMHMCLPTMYKEVRAFLEKMATREVREEEVDKWEREAKLEMEEGSAARWSAATRSRRRWNSDAHASGAEAGTVRALLRKAAAKKRAVGSLDVSTAFLNTPRRSSHRAVGETAGSYRCEDGTGHHVAGDQGPLRSAGLIS